MAQLAFIDADLAAAQPAADWLAAEGHTVALITEGQDALDAVRKDRPDCIILCVELGQVSGYTLCNKLKRDQALCNVPLLLTSALASAETFDEHRRLRTKADGYLHKPYEQQALLAALAPLLPAKAAEPSEQPAVAATPTRDATTRSSAHRAVRLGEDPSVRDISHAPFLAGGERPGAADAPVGERPTAAQPTAAARHTPAAAKPEASARAEPALPAVDLSASTQVYQQNELVGEALKGLADDLGAREAGSIPSPPAAATQQAKAPRPRRTKKTRRATASEASSREEQAPKTTSAAEWPDAAAPIGNDQGNSADESSEVSQMAASHDGDVQHWRERCAALTAECDALREQVAVLLQQKAAAEQATYTLRQGLAALVELDVTSL